MNKTLFSSHANFDRVRAEKLLSLAVRELPRAVWVAKAVPSAKGHRRQNCRIVNKSLFSISSENVVSRSQSPTPLSLFQQLVFPSSSLLFLPSPSPLLSSLLPPSFSLPRGGAAKKAMRRFSFVTRMCSFHTRICSLSKRKSCQERDRRRSIDPRTCSLTSQESGSLRSLEFLCTPLAATIECVCPRVIRVGFKL